MVSHKRRVYISGVVGGRLPKQPREHYHIHFGRKDMAAHANPRSKTVQKVLEEDISGLSAYSASHLEVPLQFELVRSPDELKDGDMKILLGLVEMTSGDDYKKSNLGWDPRKKLAEMMDMDMMYLLVRQADYSANDTNDDDEDIEMGETEDTHMEGQGAIAEDKSAGREEEQGTHTASHAAPPLNALQQLLQDYASDSDEEGGVILDDTPEVDTSAPPKTGPVTWEHAKNTAAADAYARANPPAPAPRPPEHAWKTRRIPGLRRDQPAPRAPPETSSSSDSDDEDTEEEADEEASEPDTTTAPSASATDAPTRSGRAALSADNNRILGFISFMFTYDDPPHDDREVLYLYEIHLHARLRGQGLGSNLVGFVEDVARECGVDKTMLTVFSANKGARRMYERKGYGRDECSPKDRVMRRKTVEAEYVIMSKVLG